MLFQLVYFLLLPSFIPACIVFCAKKHVEASTKTNANDQPLSKEPKPDAALKCKTPTANQKCDNKIPASVYLADQPAVTLKVERSGKQKTKRGEKHKPDAPKAGEKEVSNVSTDLRSITARDSFKLDTKISEKNKNKGTPLEMTTKEKSKDDGKDKSQFIGPANAGGMNAQSVFLVPK